MSIERQLPLQISTDDECSFDNFFVTGALAEPVDALRTLSVSQAGEYFLWGGVGTGKSHLLQAVCKSLGEDALYLPLPSLLDVPPSALLEGTEALTLLAIDDVQAALRSPPWQEALFDHFNRRRDARRAMLFSADRSPLALQGLLEDLRSRLSSTTVFQLPRLDEMSLAGLLRLRAARRGLQLSDDVVAYVLARAPRSTGELMALLDTLDRAALARGRAITIPLVNELKLLSSDP